MSLLLDALKKAEKDKQKAREAEAGSVEEVPADPVSEPDIISEEVLEIEDAASELELVLDEQADVLEKDESAPVEEHELKVNEPPLTPSLELEKSAATTSTVSDEALQLLVYKTNKRYRKRQKMIWGGLLSATVVILMTAGTYNYFGMLEEVDALERKHQLAMRDVRSEPVKRHQVATSEEASAASVISQQAQNTSEVKQPVISQAARTSPTAVNKTKDGHNVSFQKSKKEDPVNALLQDAWLAYNRADYPAASSGYEKVLKREPKNRDALLGMAAVAVKSEDYKKAKASYQLLLKLNPRDQVAMSAMANIDKLSSNGTSESKLKFMLQQQPDATHLNFALGNFYARQSKWPEAQSEYFKAWQGNSKNADYVYNLAVSLDQIGKPEQALRFYKECLTLAINQNTSFSRETVEKRIQRISAK